jgi:hypothetical protein
MRLLRLVPAILLVGAGVSQASLFSRQDDRQVAEFSGEIATVDDVSLRIRPDEGSVMTFVVDDSRALPTGLAPGTRVTVQYETREGGGRRLLSVSLAEGSSAPPPADATPDSSGTPAPDPTAALALEASPRSASAALAPDLATHPPRDASSTPTPAPPAAGGPCPLQVLAVGLLVATGSLLVIASWR